MSALLIVNCIAIIGFAIGFQRSFGVDLQKFYWFAFFIKWLAALSLGLVYTYYYPGGDTWTYFEEAKKLSLLATSDFSQFRELFLTSNDTSTVTHFLYVHDRSFLFVKIVSLLNLISGNSYWVTASYFSLVSFFSSWFLLVQLKRFVPDSTRAAVVAIFLFPSILFWSSGLLKETLAMVAIYYLTAVLIQLLGGAKVRLVQWALVFLSLWIGWSTKYYWLGIFVAAWLSSLFVFLLTRNTKISQRKSVLGWLGVFLLLAAAASFAHPNFRLERVMEVIVSNHDLSVLHSKGNNYIHYYDLLPTVASMAVNSPWALFSALFRPMPFEATGLPSVLASLENLIILVLAVSYLASARKKSPSFAIPLIVFSVVLCVFLALSTPNFGTLSRYRVGFLPFLIFVFSFRNPLLNYLTRRISFFTK
ncbi:MAG: hypothetical protein IM606_16360 [Cytophagales bacterium]|jgi:hypothetical protein|nr:hypothetical protein [Cytophagales bacterium]MCA6389535.1 hypothetical protein [Cytophagales bacterium]MCA6392659.1 hypothetical protein [Cytophagales bacterium]MCA6396758.1 hypothetical protein [Cytophagales bacterium]MCA6399334.1 hypothetical protein [Cytophagales bacterium]